MFSRYHILLFFKNKTRRQIFEIFFSEPNLSERLFRNAERLKCAFPVCEGAMETMIVTINRMILVVLNLLFRSRMIESQPNTDCYRLYEYSCITMSKE